MTGDPNTGTPILDLRNIGPASARWLRDIGVATREELRRRGPVAVYATLKRRGYRVSLNLLYALQAGLMDLHWAELPPQVRDQLRAAAERALQEDTGDQ